MKKLRVTSGPAAGQSFDADEELVIGREGADVTIDDAEISRRHTIVRPHADGVSVEDLGSTNGTFVDGQRITGPVTLPSGGTMRLGTSTITVEVEVEVPARSAGHTSVSRVDRSGAEPVAPAAQPVGPPARGTVRRIEPAPGDEASPVLTPAPVTPAARPQPDPSRAPRPGPPPAAEAPSGARSRLLLLALTATSAAIAATIVFLLLAR